ncbi:MAG: 50S ribosomal protein L15 [Deferribacteres bacterium]|nr:50S ribosomal protein L15 [candidate division KSB1 bacterium]MCB9502654.1 50S ribosomal protein L15 [Deferribacteres bacterium]
MDLSTLSFAKKSRKNRKKVGRGIGSGHGGTSCRGHKGQKSRSGGSIPPWFEGGQMPLQRRVPKRGFTNIFKKAYQLVNITDLERKSASGVVNPEELVKLGLIKNLRTPVKILGEGELSSTLEISAHKFTRSAIAKIEKAGGKAIPLC